MSADTQHTFLWTAEECERMACPGTLAPTPLVCLQDSAEGISGLSFHPAFMCDINRQHLLLPGLARAPRTCRRMAGFDLARPPLPLEDAADIWTPLQTLWSESKSAGESSTFPDRTEDVYQHLNEIPTSIAAKEVEKGWCWWLRLGGEIDMWQGTCKAMLGAGAARGGVENHIR